MINLKIKEILKHNTYLLQDESQEYKLTLEFYEVPKPNVGDVFIVQKSLLDKTSLSYSQPYAFKLSDEFNTKDIKILNHKEYAVLLTKDKIFSLKRIYG